MIKSYTRIQFYPPIQSSSGQYFLWKDKLIKAADPGPATWIKNLALQFSKKKKLS